MSYTLEQLKAMSDYEINCAVAEKFLPCDYEFSDKGQQVLLVGIEGDRDFVPYGYFDPCSDPRDYMPIAIEHGINITFPDDVRVNVYKFISQSNFTRKETIGRAVCEAFLMFELQDGRVK